MIPKKQARKNHGFVPAVILLAAVPFCTPSWAWETPALESSKAVANFHQFSDRASELAMQAMALLGIQYKYGGTSPEHGLDCSGLVGYVFKETWGTTLPRTTAEISRVGQSIAAHDLQPGDLVFYNTLRRAFSHVGIYIGDNKFIHAPSSGGKVRIERMDVGYWKNRFNGARRISDPQQARSAVAERW